MFWKQLFRRKSIETLLAEMAGEHQLHRVLGPLSLTALGVGAIIGAGIFVTTGEILITNYGVAGAGAQRTIAADVEWTFPLSFVEVVWGDGKKVGRQIISATELGAFGTKHFAIPFDATGKSWVRFAVWDTAGNGAFVQPVWVSPKPAQTTSSK